MDEYKSVNHKVCAACGKTLDKIQGLLQRSRWFCSEECLHKSVSKGIVHS